MQHPGLQRDQIVTIRITNDLFNKDMELIGRSLNRECFNLLGRRIHHSEIRNVSKRALCILFEDHWTRKDVIRACGYICRPETMGAVNLIKQLAEQGDL